MAQKILLAMDDRIASIYRSAFERSGASFDILSQNIATARSIKKGLERFKPDILLISVKHLQFTNSDFGSELADEIFLLKRIQN